LAEGDEGRTILERFAALSKPFGTTVEIGRQSATIAL
jgi:hypothetical protein